MMTVRQKKTSRLRFRVKMLGRIVLIASLILSVLPASVSGVSPGPQLDVRSFGALGNGTRDDRQAIQAAIDAAADGRSKIVFLPPGTYLVTKDPTAPWALRLRSNVTIFGSGPTSVIKLAPDQPKSTRVLSTQPGESTTGIRLENFGIDGDRVHQNPDHEQQHGVFLAQVTGATIERLTIKNLVGDGIYLYGGSSGATSAVVVRQNVIADVDRIGINFAGANDSKAIDNVILRAEWALKMEHDAQVPVIRTGNAFVGNVAKGVRGGISINGSSKGARVTDVLIANNQFAIEAGQYRGRTGINLREVDRAKISGNTITGDLWAGIRLLSDTDGIEILNNTISGLPGVSGDWACILVGGAGSRGHLTGTVISGNHLANCNIGVHLMHGRESLPVNTVIRSNVLRGNTRGGLFLSASEETLVVDNQFVENGEAGAVIRMSEVSRIGNSRVTFQRNTFVGPTGGRQLTAAILIRIRGAVRDLRVLENTFRNFRVPVMNPDYVVGSYEYRLNVEGGP